MILNLMRRYLRGVRGATAIEYGLIAGGISVAAMLAIFLFGDSLIGFYHFMTDLMRDAVDQMEE